MWNIRLKAKKRQTSFHIVDGGYPFGETLW